MKLLVFAHTPPPHHGQSYMVQLMLEGLGGDWRKREHPNTAVAPGKAGSSLGIECYHVNARVSRKLEDVGDFRLAKFVLLLGYCLQAIWCRFRYGVTTFYYVPAPGKRFALYRDWLVMLLCRPFFKRVILHWHAAGLAKWLETVVLVRSRSITFRLLKRADLSIVLSQCNVGDAEKLFANRIAIVGNGIPDPCADFQSKVLPRRKSRVAARRQLNAGHPLTAEELAQTGAEPHLFRVLFIAHCMRDKGLFDTLEGVAEANQKLTAAGAAIRVQLTVAGAFMNPEDRAEFDSRLESPDFKSVPAPARLPGLLQPGCLVSYKGFVSGAAKTRLFEESDCLCFPTYYFAESFGLVVVEGMAFGLPVVTSRWRSMPELLPPGDPGLVDVRRPDQIASALLRLMNEEPFEVLRRRFEEHYTLERHLAKLAEAFRSVELEPSPGKPLARGFLAQGG